MGQQIVRLYRMVDVANIRLGEILPILGNDCVEKERAAINNDNKKFINCNFFD